MIPSRRRFTIAVLAVALAWASGSPAGAALPTAAHARADAAPALALPFSGEVRAGETVELTWSGADAGIEELEILLSIDGGRSFGVRVSPELDPRAGRWRWRVPNLPTAEARLRLRYGRGACEIESAPSAAFRIVGEPGMPLELDQIHEGAWWGGIDPFRVPRAGLGASRDLCDGAARPSAAEPPPRDGVGREERSAPRDAKARLGPPSARAPAGLERRPRIVPPRE